MSESYAERLAKQAVIVSLAYDRFQHEMQVMAEIVKGTPPTYFPNFKPESESN